MLLALQRGLHEQQEVLKDQFVANIIWESKLRCTGALQRRRAQHRSCARYSWPLLSTVSTTNGAFPAVKVKREGQTLAGGLEGHPSGSGHSNQTAFKFYQPRNMRWTRHQQLSFRDGEQGTRNPVPAQAASPRRRLGQEPVAQPSTSRSMDNS